MSQWRCQPDVLLEFVLTAGPAAAACDTVTQWWVQHRRLQKDWPRPVELAIAGGFSADRVGWAFASAYQAALRTLVPTLPVDAMAALCVTEAAGTAPRAMQTTLTDDGHGGLVLNGAKRWTTLGPGSGLFLVAARDMREHGERPLLRLAAIPADTPGVCIQPMPPTSFVPEVPHAQLRFEQVKVSASALLPGDGWSSYVRPFRSIEDLHVHAAVLGYLVRESRRLSWPHDWTERAIAGLAAFLAIADMDPAGAPTHVVLAGALGSGERLVDEADSFWRESEDREAAARWQRDRALLQLAAQPRAARIQKAWERLAGAATKL